MRETRPVPKPLISPHPKAPLFSRADGALVLDQLIDEVATGNFPTNEAFRQILAQAGLVNLWFLIKFIMGYAGEYEKLDADVHLDMCNFRQSLNRPGARGIMFMPRGVGKSKIWTEGGTVQDLIRDPMERFRLSNAIADYAQDFMLSVKAVFDSNELFAWLYPQHIPPTGQKRWNDVEIVLPSRKKHSRMASVEFGGIGGAAASHHFTTHVVDDPISEQSLNSMRASNALMEHTKHWFKVNAPSLLDDTINSRLLVVGTRYAVDDLYDDIIKKAYTCEGYPITGFKPNPDGRWRMYYRKIIEDGRIIFPEKHTEQSLREMAEDDYWTYITQYMNDPQEAGLAEFIKYDMKIATMDFHDHEWWISWTAGTEEDGSLKEWHEPLSDFDMVQSVDPAATERYLTAKTSKSAQGVLATHWTGMKCLIELRVDYVEINVVFDWMFESSEKWSRYLRATYLEANAGFKVLGPILMKEQVRRGQFLRLQPFPAVGEKVARIRSDLDPEFSKGTLYTLSPFYDAIMEEARAFPQSSKKDTLDMLSAAVRMSRKPMSPEEKQAADEEDEWFIRNRSSVGSY